MRPNPVLYEEDGPRMGKFLAAEVADARLRLDEPPLTLDNPTPNREVVARMNRVMESNLDLAGECLGIGRDDRLGHGFVKRGGHDTAVDYPVEASETTFWSPLGMDFARFDYLVGNLQPMRIVVTAGKTGGFREGSTVSFRFIGRFGISIGRHVLLLGLGRTVECRSVKVCNAANCSEGLTSAAELHCGLLWWS
jgi:hypothetical protein